MAKYRRMRKYHIRKDTKRGKGSYKTRSISNFKEYQIFRSRYENICTRDNIENYVDYGKIVSAIYREIGEQLANNPEGVYIERLGYFGAMVYKNFVGSTIYRNKKGELVDDMSYETDGKMYCLVHVWDDTSQLIHRTFNMDYTFSRKVRKPFSDNLIKGIRYRFKGSLFQKRIEL